MNMDQKIDFERNCGIEGCNVLSLPLTEPPRCFLHIEDPHTWFSGLLSKKEDPTLSQRDLLRAIRGSHDLYREALINTYAGNQLYKIHRQKVNPSGSIPFSFPDFVYFCIDAASTGIVGNFAYDVIKSAVSGIPRATNPSQTEQNFESVVHRDEYEKIRHEYHPNGKIIIEVTRGIESTIQARHRTTMWKELVDE